MSPLLVILREKAFTLGMLTLTKVSRNDLCTHLRTLITEQKRIDATYASAEGSIPSSQAAVHSVEPRPEHKVDIRLILPPEPQSAKGSKNRPVRKHRHGTKVSHTPRTRRAFAAYPPSISHTTTSPIQIRRLTRCVSELMWLTVGLLRQNTRVRPLHPLQPPHHCPRPPITSSIEAITPSGMGIR